MRMSCTQTLPKKTFLIFFEIISATMRHINETGEKGENAEINCMHVSGFSGVAKRH